MDNRINSKQNPKVKQLVKLRERKHRDALNQFIIEGQREINEALDASVTLTECFVCTEFLKTDSARSLFSRISSLNIPCTELGPDAFKKCCYKENPDGIIAISKTWEKTLSSINKQENSILLVLENIEKPGNLGAIIRISKALGAHAIICTDSQIDLFNPNVIRASQGLIFATQIVETENNTLLDYLKTHSYNIAVTTPTANESIWNSSLVSPLAIIFGSEKLGVSDFWLGAQGTKKTKIPIDKNVDSLNLASAASIYLYEAVRNNNCKKLS